MCGIVGILNFDAQPAVFSLLQGLRVLEYRGYDSAGITTLSAGQFHRHRAAGKLKNLESLLENASLPGPLGIAHTRWATHGVPNESNAHPHMTDRVAVVHNGIIENHEELRAGLVQQGIEFVSETDTEVVLHLIDQALAQGLPPQEAVRSVLAQLRGAYALAVIFRDDPDIMIGARSGPPLAVGYGSTGIYLGSDSSALAHLTHKISYLEEGDMVTLRPTGATFESMSGEPVERAIHDYSETLAFVPSKGNYNHYMAKEIFEQPDVVRRTLNVYLNGTKTGLQHAPLPFSWQDISRLTIVACGTAYYAGLVAKYWFESMARIPVEIDVASEFRYRQPPMLPGGLALFISQSGETADTLAAQAYAQSQQQICLGVVNVVNSSLARSVDSTFITSAGLEIGVASTKAFTTQLSVLAVLALSAAQARNTLSLEEFQHACGTLAQIPSLLEEALLQDKLCQEIALTLAQARDVLYLGRGTSFALALEGALKLKEISYIHAEGYAAGELKHGPIALVEEGMPLIVIAPSDHLFEKTASNIQEVIARRGKVILLSDVEGHRRFNHPSILRLTLPHTSPLQSPLVYALPIQLLAYHTAVAKGTDVDQPRNLAKSVTVE